jgi:hypothetical protein
VIAGQTGEDFEDFVFGQDGRQPPGFMGAQGIDGAVEFLVEDVAVEEEQGAEGLTSASSVQGFWVEAATFCSTARWVRKASISAAPI